VEWWSLRPPIALARAGREAERGQAHHIGRLNMLTNSSNGSRRRSGLSSVTRSRTSASVSWLPHADHIAPISSTCAKGAASRARVVSRCSSVAEECQVAAAHGRSGAPRAARRRPRRRGRRRHVAAPTGPPANPTSPRATPRPAAPRGRRNDSALCVVHTRCVASSHDLFPLATDLPYMYCTSLRSSTVVARPIVPICHQSMPISQSSASRIPDSQSGCAFARGHSRKNDRLGRMTPQQGIIGKPT
jgi:hypothetical protein